MRHNRILLFPLLYQIIEIFYFYPGNNSIDFEEFIQMMKKTATDQDEESEEDQWKRAFSCE